MLSFRPALCTAPLCAAALLTSCGWYDEYQARRDAESEPVAVELHNPGETSSPFGRSIWEVDPAKEEQKDAARGTDEAAQKKTSPLPVTGEPGALPVLCYHHMIAGQGSMGGFNMPPAEFEAQLAGLKQNGYKSVSLDDFYAAMSGKPPSGFPDKPVLITFDDGSLSHYTTAYPLMKKYGFTGVLFIYPSIVIVGKPNYMRWNHVRELLKSGVFEAASHTYWHPMLPTLSRAELKMQLKKSKDVLEKELGISVKDLAYPFGLYDRRVVEEAKALGYRAGFTVNLGVNHRGEEPFTLSRYMVTTGTTPAAFLANLDIRSPSGVEMEPVDGSVLQAGQKIVLKVPGIADGSLALKMGGKGLDVTSGGGAFSTVVPKVGTGRGYLTLVLRAKTQDNRPLYRQYLFLDAAKFPPK